MKPDFISFDYYPFVQGKFRTTFFENLDVVYGVSKKHRIPFWGFVRTGVSSDYYQPTEGQLKLQVFANIAYGAKGIQYFTYTTPRGYKTAIIDSLNHKTTLYYVIKDINKDIQGICKIFGNQLPKYIWHSDDKNESINIIQVESGEDKGKGFLCSVFLKGNKHYLMVVNKDYDNSQTLIIHFKNRAKRVLETKENISGGVYESSLASGDCAIFQF